MKTKILLTVLLITLFSAGYAQSLHVGIKAGANLNKISGESFKDGFDFGYHAGVYAELGLGSKFSIQPEVLFVQTSTDTTTNFSAVYSTHNLNHITLNYLSIPILASYKIGKLISLQAGPQFGILMNSSENLTENGKDAFNQGDVSAVAGLQLHFLSIRAYARYIIGLNNLNDIDDQNKWNSESIQIGIGYTIL